MRLFWATTVLLTLCCGSAASAATVRVEDRFPGSDFGHRQVIVEDAGSETNVVSITYAYEPLSEDIPPNGDADVTVRDEASRLEAGPGCEQQADGSVRCQVEEVIAIEARLGGGADRGVVTPSGEVSCDCVQLMGGPGDDLLTSRDGASLAGEDGDDVLRAEPSPAERVAHSLSDIDDDAMSGGAGDDVIESGMGRDQLAGGAGDDTLRGGDGADRLTGYGGNPDDPVVDAGSDQLDGGRGNDALDDGDDGFNNVAPPDISRDVLIGGPGMDSVGSYLDRSDRVVVDLSEAADDGAPDENDALVNVEAVETGGGDDRLFGDGDRNFLTSGQGENYVRGRGGDDILQVEAPARHRVHGDLGDDVIATRPWARGPFYCGTGRDWVVQDASYGGDAPRLPDRDRNLGPVLSGNCEAIGTSFGGFGLDPKPKLDGRTLRFGVMRPPHRNPRYMAVTWATKPFKHVDRSKIHKKRTVEFRLPRWLVRRAHRKRGALLRAEFSFRGHTAGVDMVWRFHVHAPRR